MTSTAIYEAVGLNIVLSHGGEEFPEPAPGELEALTAAAKKLGYTLEREHSREPLFYYAQPILEEFPRLKPLVEMELEWDREPSRDFQVLELQSQWTLEEIVALYEDLPLLIAALLDREQIHSQVDLTFEDSERNQPTIRLKRDGASVVWTEEEPQKPITEAQLRAHYEALPED